MKNPFTSLLANRRPTAAAGRVSAGAFGESSTSATNRKGTSVTRPTKAISAFNLSRSGSDGRNAVALTTRGAFSGADGSGAPSSTASLHEPFSYRNSHARAAVALIPLVATWLLVAAGLGAAGASAAGQARLDQITACGASNLNYPNAIAVNHSGSGGAAPGEVYVADRSNHRVARFSAEGTCVSVFGLGVNQTTGGNVCTVASGDICKAGTASAAAGALWTPVGIAVDQARGTVLVYGYANSSANGGRINAFSAAGSFQGAFGWEVDATSPESKLQFCTTATGCLIGKASAAAGGISGGTGFQRALAMDASGDVYLSDDGNRRIDQFNLEYNGGGEVIGASFVRAIGWKVDATNPEEKLQTCTTATGCLQATGGAGNGQFSAGGSDSPGSLAIDAAGSIYAVTAFAGDCTAAEPCRVQKFNPDGTFKELFGPTSGQCQLNYAEGGAGRTRTPMAVTVDPATDNVLVLKKTAALEMKVCEFDTDGGDLGQYPAQTLSVAEAALLNAGIAAGTAERVYVANGPPGVYLLGPAPLPSAAILPATELDQTSARLNGTVTVPTYKAQGFPTTYQFELSSDLGFSWSKMPVPAALAGSTAGDVPVSIVASGLQPNANYLVRLMATTGGSVTSDEAQFKTLASAPSVSYILGAAPETDVVDPFGTSTAKLAGYVNPNNQLTTYRFEYGTTPSYGMQSPAEFEPSAGSGGAPLLVKANLTGLQPGTLYHYRIVATNTSGKTSGIDRTFETAEARQALNPCDLPDSRCLEMVSPPEKGAVGEIGPAAVGEDLQIQPAVNGDAIAYQIGNGLPSGTAPNEVLYRSVRGSSGWTPDQLGAPLGKPTEAAAGLAVVGYTQALSPDLSCSVLYSTVPLGTDAPTRVLEAGGANLYRRDSQTGGYEVITNLPPVNLPLATGTITNAVTREEYLVVDASDDCERVVFTAPYKYSGVAGTALPVVTSRIIYEWDGEELHGVGLVPGPSGDVEVPSSPGGPGNRGPNILDSVSDNGEKIFFTATSQKGANSGKTAVFARVGGTVTVDVTQSETAVPTAGARFQAADAIAGSKVFFTANYGIADESSAGPTNFNCSTAFGSCDLYEYDFGAPLGERLTDLSAHTAEPQGAAVAGVVATSDDGEHVYFAARGQLIPGVGPTYQQNVSAGNYSVYLAHDGERQYVGRVTDADLAGPASPLRSAGRDWSAHVTPDGRSLLFPSTANTTGFDPQGTIQAYLFSAETGGTLCVSCRRDGGVPGSGGLSPVPRMLDSNSLRQMPSITDDGTMLFFRSRDSLAPGATQGDVNLYEWRNGQTYLLASWQGSAQDLVYYGFGGDGSNVFFATPEQITWEDTDGRKDLFVARMGGGFEPPVTPVPCDPLLEGSCGGSAGDAPALVQPLSSTFSGPGNPGLSARLRCSRRQVHRGNRCVAKRALARRACVKRKGKARQRCIRNQVRRLSAVQQRQQQRGANADGRTGK